MKFKIQSLGIYAVIINPNPDVRSPTAQECGFLCRNYNTILVAIMGAILLLIIASYAIAACCKTHDKTVSRLAAESKRMAMLMANQNDSFFVGPNGDFLSSRAARNAMPPYISKEAFFSQDGPIGGPISLDLDLVDRVREVLDTVDPTDPPLMPG